MRRNRQNPEKRKVGPVTSREVSRDALWDLALAKISRGTPGGSMPDLKHALAWAADQLLELPDEADDGERIDIVVRDVVEPHQAGSPATRLVMTLDTIDDDPVVIEVVRVLVDEDD